MAPSLVPILCGQRPLHAQMRWPRCRGGSQTCCCEQLAEQLLGVAPVALLAASQTQACKCSGLTGSLSKSGWAPDLSEPQETVFVPVAVAVTT